MTNKRFSIISKLLSNQHIWDICQSILGSNKQKMKLYKSVCPKKGCMLDFGCANGNTFPAFYNYQYFGIDLDSLAINSAQKKYSSNKNASFLCANIFDKPFKKKYFDFILFGNTGHHLNDNDLLSILRELETLIKPKGYIFFFDIVRSKNDSKVLTTILNLDQGKFVRYKKQLDKIFLNSPLKETFVKSKVIKLKQGIVPKPKFVFYQFSSPKNQ